MKTAAAAAASQRRTSFTSRPLSLSQPDLFTTGSAHSLIYTSAHLFNARSIHTPPVNVTSSPYITLHVIYTLHMIHAAATCPYINPSIVNPAARRTAGKTEPPRSIRVTIQDEEEGMKSEINFKHTFRDMYNLLFCAQWGKESENLSRCSGVKVKIRRNSADTKRKTKTDRLRREEQTKKRWKKVRNKEEEKARWVIWLMNSSYLAARLNDEHRHGQRSDTQIYRLSFDRGATEEMKC